MSYEKNEYDHLQTPWYVRPGKQEWIKYSRSGKLEESIRFLQGLRDKDANGKPIINEEKSFVTNIKLGKNPPYHPYEVYIVKKNKPELTAAQQMPNRGQQDKENDLPF